MPAWVIAIEWSSRSILILLVALSVWSVAIMIDRKRHFATMSAAVGSSFDKLLHALRSGDRSALQNELQAAQSRPGTPGNFQHPGIGLLHAIEALPDRQPDAIEYVARAYLSEQRSKMEKGLTVLGTLGSNAPFIGLLGTVMGIIQAFAELSRQVGGTEAVMSGLSEALVATGLGLFVAIPAVIAFNYFSKLEKDVLQACDVAKNLYLARLTRE